jgi:hypothetical protein
LLVEREQSEQARDATVAVAERMNAEEIENERADGNERRDVILINGVMIDEAEFIYGGGRGSRGNTFEPDDGRSAGPEFDDFVIHFLELTGITAAFLAKPVEAAQTAGNPRVLGMNGRVGRRREPD